VCAQSLQEFQDADQAIRCKLYITRSFGYNSLCAMWESSQLSLLEISLTTNVKGKIRFPQEVLLSNQGKIINFPFDIGSHYLSRSWHD
jgi:hypothetical protein